MKDGKMTRSEAGRLGAEKVKAQKAEKRKRRIEEYGKNPARCKTCTNLLPYEKRHYVFCSRSCAITHNNKGLRRHGNEPKLCLNCGNKTKKHCMKFCSNSCQREHQYKEYINRWLSGEETGITGHGLSVSKHIERWLRNKDKGCMICHLTEWMGQPIPLCVDHKDGNGIHNRPENLRMVCGNCGMQLPTFAGRNRGKGRLARKIWDRRLYQALAAKA